MTECTTFTGTSLYLYVVDSIQQYNLQIFVLSDMVQKLSRK